MPLRYADLHERQAQCVCDDLHGESDVQQRRAVRMCNGPDFLRRHVCERAIGRKPLWGLRDQLRDQRDGMLWGPVRLHRKHAERKTLYAARTDTRGVLGRGMPPSRVLLRLQRRD